MRARPTHTTIVAYLALFIALGGSAYAVSAGSIGTRELRDNDVRGKDIRSRTVRGRDVNQRTLAYARPYLVYQVERLAPNGELAARAMCKRGDVALAGGRDEQRDQGVGNVAISRPVSSDGTLAFRGKPGGWYARGAATQSFASIAAYAVCLPVGRR